jgi:hypothetical protein
VKLYKNPKRSSAALSYKHADGLHFGAGPVIDESIGLHATSYFQFYHIVMSRLRLHPSRTLNREEASVFVVPFDVGVATQWSADTGFYLMQQVGSCPQADEVIPMLSRKLSTSSLWGHDVVIVNSYFQTFREKRKDIFMMCLNCLVFTQEIDRTGSQIEETFRIANISAPRVSLCCRRSHKGRH